MIRSINLNADLGEGFGAYSIGNDEAMLDIIKSANIACGFHGGDPLVIRRTVQMANARGVSIGAHPSYPDLQGFGRRSMSLTNEELESILSYQIGALVGVARSVGAEVSHVKPHGALNNRAAENIEIATVVARAIRDVDPDLILLSPAGSFLTQAGREAGLLVAEEIFADRLMVMMGICSQDHSRDRFIIVSMSVLIKYPHSWMKVQSLPDQEKQYRARYTASVCMATLP